MKSKLCEIVVALATLTFCYSVDTAAPRKGNVYYKATQLEKKGKFTAAASLLHKMLESDGRKLSPNEREKILFQIERMRRIRIDYSLTANELYAQLEKGIKNMGRQEFQLWIHEKRFDDRVIDDTLRFVNTSRSNLFFRYPDIAERRIPPVNEREHYLTILDNCLAIEKASDSLHTPYVLPKEFKMTMNLTVDSGTVRPGDTVRAWLPIPRKFPYQEDFRLISSSSNPLSIAGEESPIRSVFMEQPADTDGSVKFSIEYTYTTYGVHFNLDANVKLPQMKSSSPKQPNPGRKYFDITPGREDSVRMLRMTVNVVKHLGNHPSDQIYDEYTSEGPNIIFTSKIKKLSKQIVGNTTNPIVKANLIYDWIAHNIKYSFAREYSTINNISNYCLTHCYGDCGQEAMLFITLCRYNGIPARWQSGWFFFPGGKDIHDWTEINVEPYGWVPVDPYMGILATRYMTSLTEAQRKIVRDFYFGGLDQYRMSANSDNNQKLNPVKKFFRSDNVDFQRGEVETETHNIYFNQFDYNLKVEEESGK